MSEMTAGREMDWAVHKLLYPDTERGQGSLRMFAFPRGAPHERAYATQIPLYSTDVRDAFTALNVVMATRSAHGHIFKASIETWADGWQARIGVPFTYGIEGFGHIAPTPAEAICRAIRAFCGESHA